MKKTQGMKTIRFNKKKKTQFSSVNPNCSIWNSLRSSGLQRADASVLQLFLLWHTHLHSEARLISTSSTILGR